MALTNKDVIDYIEKNLKLRSQHHTNKMEMYNVNNVLFYVKNNITINSIVIDPIKNNFLRGKTINGFTVQKEYLRNSNLTKFPLSDGTDGKPSQHYGLAVEVQNYNAIDALFREIGVSPNFPAIPTKGFVSPAISSPAAPTLSSMPVVPKLAKKISEEVPQSAISDIENAEVELHSLTPTERATVIAARLGQGQFRNNLLFKWDYKCAVTGINVLQLLRASHIKPWRSANNHERLDSDNGLLLIATLDAAFDSGLISFRDSGEILFSSKLGSSPHKSLGISIDSKLLRPLSERQKQFLKEHRENIFR